MAGFVSVQRTRRRLTRLGPVVRLRDCPRVRASVRASVTCQPTGGTRQSAEIVCGNRRMTVPASVLRVCGRAPAHAPVPVRGRTVSMRSAWVGPLHWTSGLGEPPPRSPRATVRSGRLEKPPGPAISPRVLLRLAVRVGRQVPCRGCVVCRPCRLCRLCPYGGRGFVSAEGPRDAWRGVRAMNTARRYRSARGQRREGTSTHRRPRILG
jgi:hypothetical protein